MVTAAMTHMELIGNHIPKAGAMSQHSETGMFGRAPLPAPSSRSFGQGLSNAAPLKTVPKTHIPLGSIPLG